MKNIYAWGIAIYLCVLPKISENKMIHPADDFCEKLSGIMKYAPTNFEEIFTDDPVVPEDKIADEKKQDENTTTISLARKSSADFPGAKTSNIIMGLFTPDKYYAYFGTYKIKTDAQKKIDELKLKLTDCLKNYKLSSKPGKADDMMFAARYIYEEKRTDKITPQHVELQMQSTDETVKGKKMTLYKVYVYINGLKPLE